jgi:hypothetical protein
MKAIYYTVLYLTLLFVIFSCQRDEEIKSGKDIIISSSWKTHAYIINGEEIELEECQKDDYLTFAANGTYTDFRGLLQCPGEIQTDFNGTWTLSQDEKTLTLTSFQGVLSFSIEISESKMTLTNLDDGDIIVLILVPYL